MTKSINRVGVRNTLSPRREPYWYPLRKGRAVGFRVMSKDTEGTWTGRSWDDEAGKYSYKILGDLAQLPAEHRFDEAVRQLESWFHHVDQGGILAEEDVKGACAVYAAKLRREKSEAAAYDVECRFRRLVNDDPIGRIELEKLKPAHVTAWRERLLKRGSAKNTVNRNLETLRAALNHAHDERKVASDFAWSKALRALKVDPTEGRRTLYLDLAQRQRIIQQASAEFRPLLIAWNLLPLRPGEIAQCKVEHLNQRQKTLTIPQGKTAARTVPLSDEAFAHFAQCAKNKLPAAWLIARADGSQWRRTSWGREMRSAASKAKLPPATVAYVLRHSTITDLIVAGVDIMTVAKLSGTSVVMIDKFYGKLRQDVARKALAILSLK
jgi:integrase